MTPLNDNERAVELLAAIADDVFRGCPHPLPLSQRERGVAGFGNRPTQEATHFFRSRLALEGCDAHHAA